MAGIDAQGRVENITIVNGGAAEVSIARWQFAVWGGQGAVVRLLGATRDESQTGSAVADVLDGAGGNDTGRLYFDADGNGAGSRTLLVTLKDGLALTHDDFIVVSRRQGPRFLTRWVNLRAAQTIIATDTTKRFAGQPLQQAGLGVWRADHGRRGQEEFGARPVGART